MSGSALHSARTQNKACRRPSASYFTPSIGIPSLRGCAESPELPRSAGASSSHDARTSGSTPTGTCSTWTATSDDSQAAKAGRGVDVDGLERVKHVGVEWRAWFSDIPAFQSAQSMRERWKHVLRALTWCLPDLQTINFVLPQTRCCGGVSVGREPYGASLNACRPTSLPGHVSVPWGRELPSGAAWDPAVGAVRLGRQLRIRLTSWDTIRDQMASALDDDDGHGDGGADQDDRGKGGQG
ncbi:uncharacterized protein MAM_07292 [Metarhizium album ARSEF 1941]|uniref:Uncharacterized protein n=1 Tax=Metarhizium album (strain ARSEF 1941) TaxID=1081103 RepID=A0A0B2WLR4_METAS|nr:uncharacterized protein MAM_07292 [Metarhizium album ARSEF 1941]KHN94873.1 hypothetical protein MAM_07292 [Metarhizium album ARSEF 1941]